MYILTCTCEYEACEVWHEAWHGYTISKYLLQEFLKLGFLPDLMLRLVYRLRSEDFYHGLHEMQKRSLRLVKVAQTCNLVLLWAIISSLFYTGAVFAKLMITSDRIIGKQKSCLVAHIYLAKEIGITSRLGSWNCLLQEFHYEADGMFQTTVYLLTWI